MNLHHDLLANSKKERNIATTIKLFHKAEKENNGADGLTRKCVLGQHSMLGPSIPIRCLMS